MCGVEEGGGALSLKCFIFKMRTGTLEKWQLEIHLNHIQIEEKRRIER